MRSCWSCFEHIGGDGLESRLSYGQDSGVVCFPGANGELCFLKRDIIEGDLADLNGPKPQGAGQMDHGIGSDLSWGVNRETGKELLHFPAAQELGRVGLSELWRTLQKRRKICSQKPALVVQILEKTPEMIPVGTAGAAGERFVELCRKASRCSIFKAARSILWCFRYP